MAIFHTWWDRKGKLVHASGSSTTIGGTIDYVALLEVAWGVSGTSSFDRVDDSPARGILLFARVCLVSDRELTATASMYGCVIAGTKIESQQVCRTGSHDLPASCGKCSALARELGATGVQRRL